MKERSLWLLLGIALLVLIISLFALFLFKPVSVQSVPAQVTIDTAIGFKLDNDQFYFGRALPGSTAQRKFVFTAPADGVLIIGAQGEVGEWIVPSERVLVMKKGESRSLQLFMNIPLSAYYGNYSTNVTFTLYRPFTKYFFANVQG